MPHGLVGRSSFAVGLLSVVLLGRTARAEDTNAALVPTYVALGDSVAAGIGATDNYGYVSMVHDQLVTSPGYSSATTLTNVSVGGHTSVNVVNEQLPKVVSEIRTRNADVDNANDITVITLNVGGNDLLEFMRSTGFFPCLTGGASNAGCLSGISGMLDKVEANLDRTVGELRRAAGAETPIVLVTQYNAFRKSGCDLFGISNLGVVVLEGNASGYRGLNDRIRDVATTYDAITVDGYAAFEGAYESLVTFDCIHPTDAGHSVIASLVAEALGL